MTEELVFSGIDATTGQPATPPIPLAQVRALVRGERRGSDSAARDLARGRALSTDTLGAIEGVDTADLAEAGWGAIFSAAADPAIRDALRPLLELRRAQAGARKPGRYREFSGADGLGTGETQGQFLVRHGVAPGNAAEPDRMPYYLMVVGGPEEIPYEFQYELDAVYAVGRLVLGSAAEYGRYAAAVVAAEAVAPAACDLVAFGPRHPDDGATALSADHLIAPLAERLRTEVAQPWTVATEVGPDHATKSRLCELLGVKVPPRLLLTAGHGMVFPNGHALQRSDQGALLCQDWPGQMSWSGTIPRDFYVCGADLGAGAGPAGMIALFFACYGAGTPRYDDFLQAGGPRRVIAPAAFVSSLSQAMLAHPNGPALAVVGHVERAMSYSFAWPRAGEQIVTFVSVLRALMAGRRLGAAMEHFNNRFLALNLELGTARERLGYGDAVDPIELAGLWTARNDARNYVILGDPAVRLALPAAP